MPDPILSKIVTTVRQSGHSGCTVGQVAHCTRSTTQAAKAALELQVQAGVMSSEELFDGERYVGTVYRMREVGK